MGNELGISLNECLTDSVHISVIIPVYNSAIYLQQCIESALNQTYKNFEILLIDDGSTDNSPQICDEYFEKYGNIRTFHKKNGGASSARNYGLKEAKGQYLYFLDSDDYLECQALEKMIKCAIDNCADLVFFEAKTIDDKGNQVFGRYDYHKQYLTGQPYRIMEEMIDNKEFHVGTPFFFIKSSVFSKNDLLFNEGIIYEDMIMAYKLFSLANVAVHIHEYIYVRRLRPDSVTTTKYTEKNYISADTVYWEVSKFRNSLPKEKQSPKHLIRCAYSVINNYRQMTPVVKKKYEADYKSIIKDILDNDAYGDKALKLECKSHLLWFIYKAKEKVFAKIKGN